MPAAEPAPTGIVWAIEVDPATVRLGGQGAVHIWIAATNRGRESASTERTDEYAIDGKGSMVLGMAFGNGVREGRWSALPPGESVREERTGIDDLVAGAGDHVIAIVRGDHELARTVLHVTP